MTPEQVRAYAESILWWNARVNIVSRRLALSDVEAHIRHCLTIAVRPFADGSAVVDFGSGGGLPAIPLAATFPRVHFMAVDAVEKKTRATAAMARDLGLINLEAVHGRAESLGRVFDTSVSRATAPLATLADWHLAGVRTPAAPERPGEPVFDRRGEPWESGLICLKGGDLRDEIGVLQARIPAARLTAWLLTERPGVTPSPAPEASIPDRKEGRYLIHVRLR